MDILSRTTTATGFDVQKSDLGDDPPKTAQRLPTRSNWFESQLATRKAGPTASGFAGLRERTFPAPFHLSVTHRFL